MQPLQVPPEVEHHGEGLAAHRAGGLAGVLLHVFSECGLAGVARSADPTRVGLALEACNTAHVMLDDKKPSDGRGTQRQTLVKQSLGPLAPGRSEIRAECMPYFPALNSKLSRNS